MNPSPEELGAYVMKAKPINLPPRFLDWLINRKGIRPKTLPGYRRRIGQFLKCCRILRPAEAPTLVMAYDTGLVTDFLTAVKCHYKISTIPGFLNALKAVRKFLYIHDLEPPNAPKLDENFGLMMHVSQSQKNRQLATERAEFRLTSKTLKLFYKNFYQGAVWNEFFAITSEAEENVRNKVDFKISRKKLRLCNRVLIGAGTAYNGKRASNLSKLKFEQVMKAVNSALAKFKKSHPGDKIPPIGGRLDRTKMAKAILLIDECSKGLRPDHVVLLNPRDCLAFQLYGKFVRPNARKPPKTDCFLINSKGHSLSEDGAHFLKELGQSLKIPDLTFNNLRKLLETRNLQGASDGDVAPGYRVGVIAAATKHIGHSKEVAERYYHIEDEEESTVAVNHLLFLLEAAGHTSDEEEDEEEEEEEDEEEDEEKDKEEDVEEDGDDHQGANVPDQHSAANMDQDKWMSQVDYLFFSLFQVSFCKSHFF